MLVKSGVFCGWMSVETICTPAFSATALKASEPPRPKSESSATIATVLNGFFVPRYLPSASIIEASEALMRKA